jgi:uncharacterized membrane protein (UPF0127 family)
MEVLCRLSYSGGSGAMIATAVGGLSVWDTAWNAVTPAMPERTLDFSTCTWSTARGRVRRRSGSSRVAETIEVTSPVDAGDATMSGVRSLWAALILLSSACFGAPSDEPGPIEAVVLFPDARGATLHVEVADSEAERRLGLMERTRLPQDGGMVFLYEEPVLHSFVMRNTLIPLSIAFLGEDGRIVEIMEMVPCEAEPCDSYTPSAAYVAAVEARSRWFADHGIREGDAVQVRRT